ncbi:hypothetical protein [Vibrio cholerae]|uniref:hypothetical protein n=1 Tax=Vibrio cholerae TaxID=666 RepID=UPI0011587529|nr:hypothetical protein [Vibrio cholerae]TQP21870.1 hypothetical protein FLM00_15075 [Vibrio cholerae]TQQ18544.1 hypothetical protein FLL85_19195 [Vibrio cholerae]
MFSDLMKDKVTVLKKNGDKFEDIQASVQTQKTFIHRSDILIETGDLIQRKMSNGGTETYEVIDPGFHEGGSMIPAGYQIKHKNLGLPEAEKAVQKIIYNLNGTNSRVNNHSVDNSTNIANENSDIFEHIELLRFEINRLIHSSQEKNDALEIVDAIEEQFSSEKPSKAVVNTLIASLPHAGSIASIGSFLLSALGV